MSGGIMSTRLRRSARGKCCSSGFRCSTRNMLTIGSLDYLFQLAVEMHKLGLPWVRSEESSSSKDDSSKRARVEEEDEENGKRQKV
jgi:hypothetical protein